MRRVTVYMMCIFMLLLSGCGSPAESYLSTYAAGKAEIPAEILEAMDAETKQELLGEAKYVALTFDDGPRRDTTELLLDGLLERGAVATFFVVGQQVAGNEDIIKRMAAEGHQVGNHTYSHVRLLTAEQDVVVEEIHKTEVILQNLLGGQGFWLRPPYGLIDAERAKLVKVPMIYWTIDPEDWKLLDAEKVVCCVMEQVQPGDVILLHDFYPSSVDAALEIIDQLSAQGYTFVTMEELFRIQGKAADAGVVYAAPTKVRPLV